MSTRLRSANVLLSDLADPFIMFPVESVADTLFGSVDDAQASKFSRMGSYGVSRQSWTVEEEHYHQEEGLLLGSVFVLGQAAITQTISILNELQRHPEGRASIPSAKDQKMTSHATVDFESGLSRVVVTNMAANYFKHHYEWPEDWSASSGHGNQVDTIRLALRIGMTPQDVTDNLWIAARCLGLSTLNPRAVAQSVQGWREAWAKVLGPLF